MKSSETRLETQDDAPDAKRLWHPRLKIAQARPRRNAIDWAGRAIGVTGWIATAWALIAFGSIHGLLGAWAGGWAVYAIMSREWGGDRVRRRRVHRQSQLTATVAVVGALLDMTAMYQGWPWRIRWELLPLATVIQGAMHNAQWAPRLDEKTFPAQTLAEDTTAGNEAKAGENGP